MPSGRFGGMRPTPLGKAKVARQATEERNRKLRQKESASRGPEKARAGTAERVEYVAPNSKVLWNRGGYSSGGKLISDFDKPTGDVEVVPVERMAGKKVIVLQTPGIEDST
jgi:hypothetical protein